MHFESPLDEKLKSLLRKIKQPFCAETVTVQLLVIEVHALSWQLDKESKTL